MRKDNLASGLPDIVAGEDLQRAVNKFMRTVGGRMREFRNMQGLTIRDVQAMYGVNGSQLSRVETGKQNLTLWTAVRLAYVLGVRPWDFYLPREKAPSLKPKRRDRPPPDKVALEGDTAAFRAQIGTRIRALRTLQGMSKTALAEFSGVNLELLTRIEAGKVNIRASTAIRIADAIGVQPHELYIPREHSGIRPRTERDQDDDA